MSRLAIAPVFLARRFPRAFLLFFAMGIALLAACGGQPAAATATGGGVVEAASAGPGTPATADPLTTYSLTGDVSPVHDPSILRQGTTWYMFTTDILGLPETSALRIRCSTDKINWQVCGSVFPAIPAWVAAKVPGIVGLWAPDISYFGGLYHLYYSGSVLDSQQSVIGVATNTTLDPTDPKYKWVDQGEVLETNPGDDSNAIDPNILVAVDGSVFLNYGSYWTGLKQVQIDPSTGFRMPGTQRVNLAERPGVDRDPIEGASMIHHGGYYYLFASIDYCCNQDYTTDTYKEIVGRSLSPQGPFVDQAGTPLMQNGGTVVVQGDSQWLGAAGGTAYVDSETGESLLVFHALKASEGGAMYAWVKEIAWVNDWPMLQP